LRCGDCEIEVRGQFKENEFSLLAEDELHLLRIFLNAEGRIKEMEAPLGLSYPTLRQKVHDLSVKLQDLREQIQSNSASEFSSSKKISKDPQTLEKQILDDLSEGSLSFAEAMEKIKSLKNQRK